MTKIQVSSGFSNYSVIIKRIDYTAAVVWCFKVEFLQAKVNLLQRLWDIQRRMWSAISSPASS
jgi:hypothetical protein